MAFQLDQRDGRLCAAGDMTIYSAADMKEQLLAVIETGSDDAADGAGVLLDLSQVVELDTCGLQVLLLAQRLAAANGRRLAVVEPSAAVSDVLGMCGLVDLFRNDLQQVA